MKGTLIVIEGLDGSGKATQSDILTEYIKHMGRGAIKISFPDYAHPSSTLVRMYLNGEIGKLGEVNVYAASSFYSLDRYISYQTVWGERYRDGSYVVADRYTTSNLSHQMANLPPERWDDYIDWLTGYEYDLLGLPKPDLVIYLDMHPVASRALLEKRYGGDSSKKDIHEENFNYLLACREAALYAAKKLGWRVIRCDDKDHLPLKIEAIADAVQAVYEQELGG